MSQSKAETELQKFFQGLGKGGYKEYANSKPAKAVRDISTPLAVNMLRQMGLDEKTTTPFNLLDSGAGSGVVTAVLQETIQPTVLSQSKIISGDIGEHMVEMVKSRIVEENWVNAVAQVIDAQKIPVESETFTHVTSNISFHVVPDSEGALNECIRVLKPGGILGFTTWHRNGAGWVPDIEGAFKSFPFDAPFDMKMQTTRWGEWSDVNWIRRTLVGKGLQDVDVAVSSHLSHVNSAAEFVDSIPGMIEVVMKATWTEELIAAHPIDEVKKLVAAHLEKKYEGQGWDLTWTSIIASGRKP
ncbi:hypothetical protein VTK73DRAFT_1366 [Phialemonium thermophilum]|uniref:Methyltransferase type 11 domain-containing protein n=1 Tax=Phialemonium thermophilum TaxID=223376 RepID=A0ABR3XAR5_9PEZI